MASKESETKSKFDDTVAIMNQKVHLESKKSSYFGYLQMLYDSIPDKRDNSSKINSFLIKSQYVSRLRKEFVDIVDELNMLLIKLEEAPNFESIWSFTDLYNAVEAARQRLVPAKTDQSASAIQNVSSSRPKCHLPPIELPFFDGKPEYWSTFYQSFKINIHENSTLTNAERVQYLVGRLRDTALAAIADIIPNEVNYTLIWETLVNKYQDKRSLATFYLNNIFDLKISGNKSSSLNNFVEKFTLSMSALKQLEIPDLTDFIFLFLAQKKIDTQLLQTFELSMRSKEIPACSDLISFIRDHVKILERASNNLNVASFPQSSQSNKLSAHKPYSKGIDSQNSRHFNKMQSHSFAITSNDDAVNKCPVCSSESHDKIYLCQDFHKMSISDRLQFIKDKRYCTNCLSTIHTNSLCKSKNRCKQCSLKHHTFLHLESVSSNNNCNRCVVENNPSRKRLPSHSRRAASALVGPSSATLPPPRPIPVQPVSSPVRTVDNTNTIHNNTIALHALAQDRTVLLSTAQVIGITACGEKSLIRCLIDSASQNNLITLDSCNRLKLNVEPLHNAIIKSVGSLSTPIRGYVALKIQSRLSDVQYNIQLIVVDKITENLPTTEINLSQLDYLKNLPLADESWYIPDAIDAILGAQLFPYLLLGGRIAPPNNHITAAPCALETTLGYVIMGDIPTASASSLCNVAWSFGPITNDNLNDNLKCFWELEELPLIKHESPDDLECEKIFQAEVSRDQTGRYIVPLPFKYDPSLLGDSFGLAKRRFAQLERKLKANPSLRESYNSVINEYIQKGYLSEMSYSSSLIQEGYFIPHHAVVRPDKTTTKTRIVLDASAKTSTDLSLNDLLHTGPNLQANLFTLLLNFRYFPIAVSADVQQMYLRILVSEKYRKYQKIIFRFNESEQLRIFQFNSVAFGLKCSPYLALRTIRQVASDEQESFPQASMAATNDVYMDDFTSSVMSVEHGIVLAKELVEFFKSGSFDLVKWSSNSSQLLENVPESHRAALEFPDGSCLKVLGLKWIPASDVFTFSVSLIEQTCTKRVILSLIARLFDVLGLVSPVILYAKLLIQELWLAKVGWDDTDLPQDIIDRFNKFKIELPLLSQLEIPRHLGVSTGCVVNIVGFGDASLKAYGCVLYLHITQPDGSVSMHLVCSKSKLAPLSTQSLARLELCASLLLAKLMRNVFDTYNNRYNISEIFAFSDSEIALAWINSSPHRWQVFVANRVSKIHENISASRFFHISGIENPSDCVSRGLLPSQLNNHSLWWQGPSWALYPTSEWPIKPYTTTENNANIPELKKSVTLSSVTVPEDSIIYTLSAKISSWSKLLRIVVYVLRFARKLPCRSDSRIQGEDINTAEIVVLRCLQQKYFAEDIAAITKTNLPSANLRKLNPFIDSDNLLRVGGRLRNANIPYNNRHPLLLPKHDHMVNLIIEETHRVNCHAGSNLLMSLLRQRFWILAARSVIRQRIRLCNNCFKVSPSVSPPLMADLPPPRVQEAKAFTHTGVDYAGPVYITLARRRGIKSQKAFICLFVCLTTRALHTELVSDLSTDSFIDALKRFIARRGPVACIYSDNGTNFVGARRQLDEIYQLIYSKRTKEAFQSELNIHKIKWSHIPPRAPHFGGLWEGNLRPVKAHLSRVIGTQILTYEELQTVLVQIECLLNSRPLCLLSDEPQPEVLTPAHFLNTTPLKSLPACEISEPGNIRDRKKLLDSLVQSYWKKWRLDYLHTLQVRQKWNSRTNPLKVGTVVLLQEENVQPLYWPMGIIDQVYPGKDGQIRVATVRTQFGIYKRPVVKLFPLPSQ